MLHKHGIALVDYHNVHGLLARPGTSPRLTLEPTLDLVATAFDRIAGGWIVDARLYGGWLDEIGNATESANVLLSLLPYLRGRRKGSVVRPSLATALLGYPPSRLHGTLRTRARSRREKMVDQMLGSDLVHLARADNVHAVVFSDDDDLVPPLITACIARSSSTRLVRSSRRARPNDALLASLGLEIDKETWHA